MKEFKELTRFDDEQLNQFATHLSGGQQRILDFALTVMGKPKFIILDEPTSAMDASMRRHFWKVIEAYKKKVKLFSTQLIIWRKWRRWQIESSS